MSGVGVLAAAAEVEAFCRRNNWQFCFIGGIAVQRWGTPRFTQDVDLTLFTGFGAEAEFVDAFLGQFPGRLRDRAGLPCSGGSFWLGRPVVSTSTWPWAPFHLRRPRSSGPRHGRSTST